jgi:hypothetical protein
MNKKKFVLNFLLLIITRHKNPGFKLQFKVYLVPTKPLVVLVVLVVRPNHWLYWLSQKLLHY